VEGKVDSREKSRVESGVESKVESGVEWRGRIVETEVE